LLKRSAFRQQNENNKTQQMLQSLNTGVPRMSYLYLLVVRKEIPKISGFASLGKDDSARTSFETSRRTSG